MKQSKYNYISARGDESVLYNTASDRLLIIDHLLVEMLNKYSVERIAEIHPQFYHVLCQYGFLVEENVDEHAKILIKWDFEDNDESTFSLTINPTLKCNLRCWYCYEDHENPPADMSKKTLEAVRRFIDDTINQPKLEHFHLSFFGGEPFLRFTQVVIPLIEYCATLCKELNKVLSVSFTTNGVLISDRYISQLASFDVPLSFQITLDGNKEFHNTTRVGKTKKGTYSVILSNIKNLLAKLPTTQVVLRCNYTAANLQSFADVATDFKNIPNEYKQSISLNFERVWQDKGISDVVTPEIFDWVMQKFSSAGFDISKNDYVIKHRCYADSNRAIVINSDGKLFRCTARDFHEDNSEGYLLEDGTLMWNERYAKRLKTKGGSNACKNCIIFPICGASCSQNRLEKINHIGCILDRNRETISEILEKRVDTLIEIRTNQLNTKSNQAENDWPY